MKNWKATTESGAEYTHRNGHIHITASTRNTWPQGFRYWMMQTPVDTVNPDNVPLPWAEPDQWQDVTEPIIGRRLYVSGKDEWRISTHIVKIEELTDGD